MSLFLALVYVEIYPPLPIPFSQMSRFEMLKSFDGAEKGSAYWQDKVNTVFPNLPTIANRLSSKAQYIKTTAYRLRPMQEDGYLAIDGERFPFKEYYAEVHRGLATVLSMSGRYPVEFTLEQPKSREGDA